MPSQRIKVRMVNNYWKEYRLSAYLRIPVPASNLFALRKLVESIYYVFVLKFSL